MKISLKRMLSFLSVGALVSIGSVAQAATWQGGTGNWTDDNWNLDAPDGYPGDATYTPEQAMINGAGHEVNVTTVIPNGIDVQPRRGTLNINSGGSLTSASGFALTTGGASAGIVNVNTGGTLTMNHSHNQARYGDGIFNVSGGTVNWTGTGGGAIWAMRSDGSSGDATVNITAGSFNALGANPSIRMENQNGLFQISGGALNGGNAILEMDSSSADGKNSTFRVDNADATAITFRDMELRVNAANTSGEATSYFQFAPGFAGVTPITVTRNLRLGEGTSSRLIVSLAGAAFNMSEQVLFDYTGGTLFGTFDEVIALGQEGTINYTGGNGTQITFTPTQVAPEPSSLALLGLGACMLNAVRKRRKQLV